VGLGGQLGSAVAPVEDISGYQKALVRWQGEERPGDGDVYLVPSGQLDGTCRLVNLQEARALGLCHVVGELSGAELRASYSPQPSSPRDGSDAGDVSQTERYLMCPSRGPIASLAGANDAVAANELAEANRTLLQLRILQFYFALEHRRDSEGTTVCNCGLRQGVRSDSGQRSRRRPSNGSWQPQPSWQQALCPSSCTRPRTSPRSRPQRSQASSRAQRRP